MNKLPLPFSQEILNAFVDGEIEAEERDRIIEMESSNEDVANAICELRRLKELVKAAKESETVKQMSLPIIKKRNHKIKYVLASIVIMFVISISVIQNNNKIDGLYSSGLTFSSESTYRNSGSLLTAARNNKKMNLVLHLKSSQPKQAEELINLIESVLDASTELSNYLQVEVIVSGQGFHLLQNNPSAYSKKINFISKEYRNVTFIACGKTLRNLQNKNNKKIQLIEDAMLVSSGPLWVEQRQKKGWAYILI